MNDEQKWAEISNDISNVAKKIKSRIDEEDLVEDLKDTFKNTIENTSQLINNIIQTVESTVTDEVIKKETKEIVWKKQWPDVAQQHCPVVTSSGTLVAFCNGNIRPPGVHHSRIVEFDLESKEMVWSYVDDMPSAFFSPYMGSVQRLWNGNTLICESAFGRIFEVTPLCEVVWEYIIPEFSKYPHPLNELNQLFFVLAFLH